MHAAISDPLRRASSPADDHPAPPSRRPPSDQALRFADDGRHSQVRAFAGEVLYTVGMPAGHLYVVKEGEVDLYLVRDEKRTVVETLRRGQCFGMEPHLHRQRRMHNAAARTYCELLLVDQQAVRGTLAASPALAQGMLETLSERLAVAHELIATRVNHRPDLLVYAQLLALLGAADLGRQPRRGDAAPALARPLVQEVVTSARLLFGHSDKHIRGCLARLAGLHLVRFDDERGTGKQVLFSPKDIVAQVRQVLHASPEDDKLRYEYLSVDEFAQLVDADRRQLLRKLATDEFADDLFTFRREEILRLLDAKGRRFFVERRIKPPDEFSDLADLEFADAASVFAVVSRLDAFALAQALSALEDGPARERILQALSQRRRAELQDELDGLGPVDPVAARQLGQQIVADVKALMLQRGGLRA